MKICLFTILAIVTVAVGLQLSFMPVNAGDNDGVLYKRLNQNIRLSRKGPVKALKPTPAPLTVQQKKSKKEEKRYKSNDEVNAIIVASVINPLKKNANSRSRFSRVRLPATEYSYKLFAREEGRSIREFEVSYTNGFKLITKDGKPILNKANSLYKGYVNLFTGECFIYQTKDKEVVAVKASELIKT